MIRRIALFVLLLSPLAALGQIGAVQGFCDLGGTGSVTSGLSSSNYLLGVIPQCTVTVYLHNTTTIATIYADESSTPLTNPFTAQKAGGTNAGGWIFWAATNQGLDVQLSGGIAPNTFSTPNTLTDVYPTQSFSPVVQPLQVQTNSVNNLSTILLNLTNTTTLTWTNPSGGIEQATVINSPAVGGITVTGVPNPGQILVATGPTAATWVTGSATSINVNGSVVSNPNINGTTPAADAGYTLGTWKVSGSNVSVELPVTGVTSLNALTGGVTLVGDSTITVTPSGQNIDLHATGGGSGVLYPTYTYVMMGSSIQTRDDTHVAGQTITVTSGSCASGTCSITNSGTNGLSVGDWVVVGGMTGFPQATFGGVNALGTNLDTFKATAATATTFSFSYSGTATITGGTAYGYNYVTPYLTQTKPYFNGHGTVETIGLYPSGGSYGLCTDMNTNYTATYHTIATSSTMFIITDCHNDWALGESAATVEAAVQALAVKIHADGALLAVDSPSSDQFSCGACSTQESLFAEWLLTFKKAYNSVTGQYADFLIPMKSALNNSLDPGLFVTSTGELEPGGFQRAADEYNSFMASAGTLIDKDTPWAAWRESTGHTYLGYLIHPPVDSIGAFAVTNAAESVDFLDVDTTQGIVNAQRLNVNGSTAASGIFQVSTTSAAGYFDLADFYTPNLAAGWNYLSPNPGYTSSRYFGVNNSPGNAMHDFFANAGNGNAGNGYSMGFIGDTKDAFLMLYNGGVPRIFFPSIAPASGGPDCLQIASSTGEVTSTGAACGGGTSPVTNITGSLTVTGCTVTSGVCTVGTAVASVSFASIPGTYNNLRIVVNGSTSATGWPDYFSIQLNGDTGAHYTSSESGFYGGGVAQTSFSGVAYGYIGSAVPYSYTSGPGSTTNCYLANYSKTNLLKNWACTSSSNTNNGAFTGTFGGFWQPTSGAAITSIVLLSPTASVNLGVGTTISIYGEN